MSAAERWKYTTGSSVVNLTEDTSTTNYVGILVMTDTRTGNTTTREIFNGTAASTYERPQNAEVSKLSGNCISALMSAAYAYPGARVISDDKPALDADHAEVVDSWNHIVFRYVDTADDAGDYIAQMVMEGDYGRA